MTETEIKSLIAGGEKLTVEFKGEEREAFNDRALYENVVCLGLLGFFRPVSRWSRVGGP